MKKIFFWFHKWLGILSGVIVVVIGITGCIQVFQQELTLLLYSERYVIPFTPNQQATEPKPLSELINIAESSLKPNEKVSRVDLYPAKNRTWIFRAVDTDKTAFGYWNYFRYYKRVFINPYTGKIKKIENTKTEFFQIVLQLHMNLLLGKKIGQTIVAIATAIFVFLVISGIILWWPKKWKKKTLKKSLLLNRKVKWKRMVYDFHNVLGFYSLFFALVFGITGLVFAFPAFKKNYIRFFNYPHVSNVIPNPEKKEHLSIPQRSNNTLDNGLKFVLKKHPEANMMSIRIREDKEPIQDIQIRMIKDKTSDFIWYYFKKSDGQIEEVKSSKNLLNGDKLASMNYDLHVGSIGGYTTKILAFIFSLICASLPITGFIMWRNKQIKKRTPKKN